ncbi:hypothetical protein [Allonocardiopsis opalescens]|uniref:Uncharacterized protein n=1 Tax=Allonocardiopsis opalescens TaxID=1144618 RepID=A0A2T0QA28_9ACTN|nr:hypothetical protein [Allonocardiopsis opalescens]PRY00697.1 hypothetical protein CLV72_102328 [Allonocardiopsis opalescens]
MIEMFIYPEELADVAARSSCPDCKGGTGILVQADATGVRWDPTQVHLGACPAQQRGVAERDALVLAAFDRLPTGMAERCRAEIDQWFGHLWHIVAAARRGVLVSRSYRRPLHEQLKAEGDRRAQLDDRTWIVWDAFAESARLGAAPRETEHEFE